MNRIACLAIAGLLGISAAAAAQGPRLAVLDKLLPGSWTLHEIGSAGTGRSICVGDPGLLLQIHHGSLPCQRFVVASGARTATIHYTCQGQGYGRTTLTAESPGLLRIQTQGLAGGSPFDVDYEARRGGACTESARN